MILILLGHKGLLGNAALKFFTYLNFDVITIPHRWPSQQFKAKLQDTPADFIINCIGAIPQKPSSKDNFALINKDLPIWLDKNTARKIIHPTTDCEFRGTTDRSYRYRVTDTRDATDDYGISKAQGSMALEKESLNTKIIRTSIIGIENDSAYSLLSWFLSKNGTVDGYLGHYWNGITTLEWCKQALNLMLEWNRRPLINQVGTTEVYSKYKLLLLCKDVFNKSITVNQKETDVVNKTLLPDIIAKDLPSQLVELKQFYQF
jgi:dTDP-4-dehydrorhamnose reductase